MTRAPAIVLFDWDNTLSDTFPALFKSYNWILAQYGKDPWDEAMAKARIRKVGHETFPGIFGDKWEEALDLYRSHYREHYPSSPIFDGTKEVLERLKEKGARLGVISNKLQLPLELGVEASGFKPLMDVVIGAVPERKGKPDPQPMEEALRMLGYDGPRDDVWYVGDTDVDMEFAKNSGAKAVFVEHVGLDKRDDIMARYAPHGAHLNLRDFLAALD